jgi:alpha-ketoglutarate-dependent taurine dioxygenase
VSATVVTELGPEIGVEIAGLYGHEFVNASVAAECQSALEAHGVVVYREAHMDDDDLAAFSRLLGQVHVRPLSTDSGHPEISVVSLDPSLSLAADVQRGTFVWHIDGTTEEFPHKATLLTCWEVSNDGSGDTEFANTYAAYAALSDEDKAQIADVFVEYGFSNEAHRKTPGISDEARAKWESYPQRFRPLVWTRRNGRKSMLLGSTAGEVVGWPYDEGRALLDRLLAWSTQPRFVLRHRWRRGDLVVWDNTGMLHRALPYELSSRRLMHRTALVGDEGVA